MSALNRTQFLALSPTARIDWWHAALDSEVDALRFANNTPSATDVAFSIELAEAANGAHEKQRRISQAAADAAGRAADLAWRAAKAG